MRIYAEGPGALDLGKQGEHLAREIAFREPAAWRKEFGSGAAQLLACPPEGGAAYPVVLDQEEGLAVWRVASADTARAGYGRCELRWSVDGRVVKSKTYVTYVARGLSCGCGGGSWDAYLEQVARAGAEALNAAVRAENAALHEPVIREGTWWVWSPEADGYADTGVPASGCAAAHPELRLRDAAEQHPISAITGLQDRLDRTITTDSVLSVTEILKIMEEM